MKAIVTVVGKDQVGIIAGVCNTLAASNINVLDISQTIMEGYFTMMMVVDLALCTTICPPAVSRLTNCVPRCVHTARAVGSPFGFSARISSTRCTSCKRDRHAESTEYF